MHAVVGRNDAPTRDRRWAGNPGSAVGEEPVEYCGPGPGPRRPTKLYRRVVGARPVWGGHRRLPAVVFHAGSRAGICVDGDRLYRRDRRRRVTAAEREPRAVVVGAGGGRPVSRWRRSAPTRGR